MPEGLMAGAAHRKSVRTSVILAEGDYTRIQALAEASDVSTAWIIRAALLRFLEEYGDQGQLPLRLPKLKKTDRP